MCTDYMIFSNDGNVSGRNMDFHIEANSEVVYVPKGTKGPIEDNLKYPRKEIYIRESERESKYSFFAINGFLNENHLPEKDKKDKPCMLNVFSDGMNEKGLSAALLTLRETLLPVSEKESKDGKYLNKFEGQKCLELAHLVEFLLGRYESVQEIYTDCKKLKFPKIVMAEAFLKMYYEMLEKEIETIKNEKGEYCIPASNRLIVHDKYGHTLIIEWLMNGMNIFTDCKCKGLSDTDDTDRKLLPECNTNALPVIANSPPYQWHIENCKLHTWLELTTHKIKKDIELPNKSTLPANKGAGIYGLPADLSSPTRFLRALALSTLSSYNIMEQEKEEKESYKLTEQSYKELEKDSLPEGILEQLKKLKGKPYPDKTSFVGAVKKEFSANQTNEHKSAILKSAEGKLKPILRSKIINHVFQLNNILSVPKYYRRSDSLVRPEEGGTMWSVARDHKHLNFYIQSYENKAIKKFSLDSFKGIKKIWKSPKIDEYKYKVDMDEGKSHVEIIPEDIKSV